MRAVESNTIINSSIISCQERYISCAITEMVMQMGNVVVNQHLAQNDRYITGKGEKWWINGNEIPFSQHDPIVVSGIIRDKDLPLYFTLKGSNRETVGIFNLEIMSNKKLIGTFSTTGANSRGSVVMSRPSNDI